MWAVKFEGKHEEAVGTQVQNPSCSARALIQPRALNKMLGLLPGGAGSPEGWAHTGQRLNAQGQDGDSKFGTAHLSPSGTVTRERAQLIYSWQQKINGKSLEKFMVVFEIDITGVSATCPRTPHCKLSVLPVQSSSSYLKALSGPAGLYHHGQDI